MSREPLSLQSYTYAFLPQSLLRSIFSTFSLDLPQDLLTPDLSALDAKDTIPLNIDQNSLSYISKPSLPHHTDFTTDKLEVKWYNNGVAHSFHTHTILDTAEDPSQGWTTIETTLVRLNSSYTPSGKFPVYGSSVPDINGLETRIGYDVAVCMERYEPWIVETYNSSIGSPTTLGIVERGGNLAQAVDGTQKMKGEPVSDSQTLGSADKQSAFFVAHDNSINQMVKVCVFVCFSKLKILTDC